MQNKFIVVLPVNIQQLSLGFSTYKETKTIVCEAGTALEVYNKYPQAIIIQPVKVEE